MLLRTQCVIPPQKKKNLFGSSTHICYQVQGQETLHLGTNGKPNLESASVGASVWQEWFPHGKYFSAQSGPDGGSKWSRHLDWVQYPYVQCPCERTNLYQSMCSEIRYEDGKLLGSQPHPTHRLASTHCVPNPSPIKGSSNMFILYSHTF